jgi:hypothetical protein
MANSHVVATKKAGGKVKEYTVYPLGDTTKYGVDVPNCETPDKQNVKFAIDNVEDGGAVVLKSQTKETGAAAAFNFGGDDEVNTIDLTKSVTIQGEDVKPADREWVSAQGWRAGVAKEKGATIAGGRFPFRVGFGSHPVSFAIENIRFDGFYRCAIRVFASIGKSKIFGCSFINYQKGKDQIPIGAYPLVVDAGNQPNDLSGQLRIESNYFGPPPAADPPGSMANLLHVSHCNLNPLKFEQNRIEDMYWVGFAVYGNQGETIIKENDITKKSSYLKGGAAISVGAWPGAALSEGPVTIQGNRVDVSSANSHAISVFFYQPSSEKLVVRDNEIHMTANPNDIPARAALACTGAACRCTDAKWHDNVVTGSAPHGIWVSDRPLDFIAPNQLQIPDNYANVDVKFSDNQLEGFTATKAQVFVDSNVKKLKLVHNRFGAVTGGNAKNPYTAPPGLPDPHAGILWRGDFGRLADNDFHKSQILGWKNPPDDVGCVYLDAQSEGNTVDCHGGDFPPAGGPPPKPYDDNQIYDAGVANVVHA